MKKKKYFIVSIIVSIMLMVTVGCGSNKDSASVKGSDNGTPAKESYYTEPLTGAVISLPSEVVGMYSQEISTQYGVQMAFSDVKNVEEFAKSKLSFNVTVNSYDSKTIGDVFSMVVGMPDSYDITIFESSYNYISFEAKSDNNKEYYWLYLLNDGSALTLFAAVDSDYDFESSAVSADFSVGEGELSMMPLEGLEGYWGPYNESGFWITEDEKYIASLTGEHLFQELDIEKLICTAGVFDDFWKTAEFGENSLDIEFDEENLVVAHEEDDRKYSRAGASVLAAFDEIEYIGFTPSEHISEVKINNDPLMGVWLNDTIYCRIQITRGDISIEDTEGFMSTSYELVDEVITYGDGEQLSLFGEDELVADSYSGTFYRDNGEEWIPSLYAPFVGDWVNETTDAMLQISTGNYTLIEGGGLSGSSFSAYEDETFFFGEDEGYFTDDDGIEIDGIDGVFYKQ